MKTKKIISIITVTFLAFNMFGCASDEKINNEKDDYTSSSETTKKSTDKPAETTTIAKSTEEPTTEIKEYGSISITKGDWAKEYDFLFDYQDIVIKHFDGKEFHNGTTTDGTNGIDGKDAAIQSETAPEDTSQLWLDITTDELKRHVNGEWCVINDYSSELDSIKQQLNDSTKDLNTKIGNVNNAIEEVTTTYNSMLTETAKGWEANLNKVTETVTANNDAVNKRIDEINDYLTYQIETVDGRETGVLTIGTSDSDIKLKLVNNIVYFEQSGHRVAYISNNKLYITDAEFLNSMRIGNFNFVPRSNGSLDFKKAGD